MRTKAAILRLLGLVSIGSLCLTAIEACSPAPLEGDRRLAVGAEGSIGGSQPCLKLADPVPGYEVQIQGLMAKYCVSCHTEPKQPPYLATYEQVKSAAAASKAAIIRGSMPVKPVVMSEPEKALFSAWVDGQMPAKDGVAVAPGSGSQASTGQATTVPATQINTVANCKKPSPAPAPGPVTAVPGAGTFPGPGPTSGPSAAPPNTPVSYAAVIAPYLQAKCNSCHRVGGTPPVLTDFASAKLGAARSLVRMKAQTMPLTGGNTAKEIGDFELWIQGGMLP
ncbi:MAG: hypothetical protein FJ146_00655 [Deltaproteobacteria bacterium]|nr:hypothetical protein [Deltaproteobacteria bacterium]